MQSAPFPRYLVPLRSKYSPQHHIFKHPQLPFLPQCQRPSFTPIQNNRQRNIQYSVFNTVFNPTPNKKWLFTIIIVICWIKYRNIQYTVFNPTDYNYNRKYPFVIRCSSSYVFGLLQECHLQRNALKRILSSMCVCGVNVQRFQLKYCSCIKCS